MRSLYGNPSNAKPVTLTITSWRNPNLLFLTTAHWLCHSHASHSLEKGAPLSLVKESLGHSSIAITKKYLHAKADDSSGMYLFD